MIPYQVGCIGRLTKRFPFPGDPCMVRCTPGWLVGLIRGMSLDFRNNKGLGVLCFLSKLEELKYFHAIIPPKPSYILFLSPIFAKLAGWFVSQGFIFAQLSNQYGEMLWTTAESY